MKEAAELEKKGKEKQIETGFPGLSQLAHDFLKWRRKESQF